MWPSEKMPHSRRSVNISALLNSGEFFIDDNGYLVSAINGTRYRLPSGPPEGRSAIELIPVPSPQGKNQQLADSAAAAVEWIDKSTHPFESTATTPLLLPSDASLNVPGTLQISLTLVACSLAVLTNIGLLSISCWHLCKPARRRKVPLPGNTIQMQHIQRLTPIQENGLKTNSTNNNTTTNNNNNNNGMHGRRSPMSESGKFLPLLS